MKTIQGTCHFVSLAWAEKYYLPYGYTPKAVAEKITSGEIHIGPPPKGEGQTISVIPGEGRYSLTTH